MVVGQRPKKDGRSAEEPKPNREEGPHLAMVETEGLLKRLR